MLKRRLIPVLYLKDGWMVRSELFKIHQVIGHPVHHVERLVQWDVDELIVLDIGVGESTFEIPRDDYRVGGAKTLLEFISGIASNCRIPLTFGGRIRDLEDARIRIRNGADKVSVNTAATEEPALIGRIARAFGSQAVVVSIDYRMIDGEARVFADHASRDIGRDVVSWARQAEDHAAGEILLNAVDRDGTAKGYDLATTQAVSDAVEIPVITCGGAGHQRHFMQCFEATGASAVAAGNIFHFTENAYPRAKAFLRERRADIR